MLMKLLNVNEVLFKGVKVLKKALFLECDSADIHNPPSDQVYILFWLI